MQGNQEPLRIVYVSPYYDPDVPSGANRRFDEICRRMAEELGHNFTLIVARGKIPTWWKGGNLVEVDYRFNHWTKFRAARQIAKTLNTLPSSIVIVESVPIPFRALQRHTHVQTAYDFRYFYSFSKGIFYRLFFSRFLKWQWRRCEYIQTCTDFATDELEKFVGFPRERVIKSFFGINDHIFDIPKAEKKDFDLIYVGHFDRHKNHAPLVDAIALLNKDLRVAFIGVDNGLQATVEARAKEKGLTNILFTRLRSEQEVWEHYARSKVFISPSLYEGFGMPTIEALALGLPIAISDIPVFHEVGGDLAHYFNPRDPHSIAETLRSMLENPTPPDSAKVRDQLAPFLWSSIYKKFMEDLRQLPKKG